MPPQNYQPGPPSGYPPQPVQPYQSANSRRHMNGLLIPFIIVTLFLLGAIGFGIWAFTERDLYMNKTNEVVEREVARAEKAVAETKDKQFLEDEKKPLKEYKGPSAYGGISIMYPKTWSAQVTEQAQGTTPVDGFFHPNFVPGPQSGTAFALRVQILDTPYNEVAKTLESQVKIGKLKAAPYRASKVPGENAGMRLDGEVSLGKQGSIVLLPLRDKTIKIYTENVQFMKDFDEIILANFNFVP